MGRKINSKVVLITRCALFCAVTAVLAQIAFPVGGFIFTMGIMGAMICGALLPPAYAFISQLGYLGLGTLGLPVFAAFQGGLHHLLGPTGGFLLTYPLVALVVSLLCRRGVWAQALGYGLSLCICYGVGAARYSCVGGISFFAALGVTVLPFVAFDIIKAVLCGVLSGMIRKRIKL